MDDLLDLVAEPSNKATIFATPTYLSMIHRKSYRLGYSSLSFIEEKIITSHSCLPFPMGSPFYEAFNEKIDEIIESGIVSMWKKDLEDFPRNREEIGPQILTMEHLEFGFLACLIILTMSVIAFTLEILIASTKTGFKLLVEYSIACNVVRTYVRSILRAL